MFTVPDHALGPKRNGGLIGPPIRAQSLAAIQAAAAPRLSQLRVARITGAALVACGGSNSRDTDLAVVEVERGLWVGAFARLALSVGLLR